MIIIGSTALKYHGIKFREPKDIDVMVTEWQLKHDNILVTQEILDAIPHVNTYATMDAVYTIKLSHLAWDIKWEKHKCDVLYLQALGAKKLEKLYALLLSHWTAIHGSKSFLSLYKKKTDFFDDFVTYVYDHDYLHSVVASPNEPVYSLCLKDNEAVAIDKKKFDMLPKHLQLKMFKEEVAVIAAERWLIPEKWKHKYNWHTAHHLALHKTITSLTKGWATQYILDNLAFFVKPDFTYYKNLFTQGITTMNTTNAEELIEEIVQAYNATSPQYPHHESDDRNYALMETPSFDGFEMIEQVGGEDEGTSAHMVFKWKGQLYKYVYSYQSFNGYEFDDAEMLLVEAKQKTITVYE